MSDVIAALAQDDKYDFLRALATQTAPVEPEKKRAKEDSNQDEAS
jgi:hypothetical protein